MPANDAQMAWMRKQIYITPYSMMGVIANVGSIDAGVTEIDIGTFGPVGFDMVAGEFMTGVIPIPYDLDPKFEIGFKVLYSANHDGSGDATISWILQYRVIKEGIVYAAPTQVLDTIIPLLDKYTTDAGVSVTTDFLFQVSDRGVALAATHAITRANVDATTMLMIELEADALANMTTVQLQGIVMDYAVHKCTGLGSENDNPLVAGDQL